MKSENGNYKSYKEFILTYPNWFSIDQFVNDTLLQLSIKLLYHFIHVHFISIIFVLKYFIVLRYYYIKWRWTEKRLSVEL
jgi:hypothetical protein